jgi:hypothetical protein
MIFDPDFEARHRACCEVLKAAWSKRPATARQRWFLSRYQLEVDGELNKFSAWVAINDYCRTHPLPARSRK